MTSNVSAGESDELTSPAFHQLFTSPIRAANTATTNLGGGGDYFWSSPTFRAPDTPDPSAAAARRHGKSRKRPKRRKNELPSVRKDSSGEIYLPSSDISHPPPSHRRRSDHGGRALPPVSRNSTGDVYLPSADRIWRQHRLHDRADSETTPSSVILQQIDNIYGKYDKAPSSCQYFSNCRPPRGLDSVVEDDRDHPFNEEDSVTLQSFMHVRTLQHLFASFLFLSCISVYFFVSSCSFCCYQGCICQIFTGCQSFDWRLATRPIAGMEVAKLVPWNSLLN